MFKSSYDLLAHHWVYNTDYSHCRDNRMFSEDDKIFSYGHHFLIARKIRNKKTKEIICYVFNSNTYGNTTSKHQRTVLSAIPYSSDIIHISDADWSCSESVVKELQEKYLEIMKRAKKARQNKPILLGEAANIINTMKKYLHFAPLSGVKVDNRKISKFWKSLLNAESLENLDIEGALLEKIELEKTAKRKKAAANKKAHKLALKRLEDWKNGIGQSYHFYGLSEIFLRIKNGYIETTEGANISIKGALSIAKMLDDGTDIKDVMIEGFKIHGFIGKDKEIFVIGCHNIPTKEILRIKKMVQKAV